MGRFSEPLAVTFADAVGIRQGQRALDVGCGPGALTAELVSRLGAGQVCAVDPSAAFVSAATARLPGVDIRRATAESLPFAADEFDAALAQLVVHFMADPIKGVREMARVTRPGGTVAACVWDHAGRKGPISAFWDVVREFDPGEPGEALLAGTERGQLGAIFHDAGLREIREFSLAVSAAFDSFDDWWAGYTYGIGPAGDYVARLDDERREALRAACKEQMPSGSFAIVAECWCATGVA